MPGLANKGNILVALNILKLLSGALFSYVTTVKSEEGVLYPQLLLLFNHSVISDSMQPYGLQHARLPCPSLSSWSGSHSCPLSQWCHSTISSSGIPFSCYLQSLPESESFQESVLHMRWSKYWSFSFSISPSNEYSGLVSSRIDWFHLLADQEALKSLPQCHSWKHQFFSAQPSLWSNSHIHTWLLEKP